MYLCTPESVAMISVMPEESRQYWPHSDIFSLPSVSQDEPTVPLTEIRSKVQSWHPGTVPITTLLVYTTLCTFSRIRATSRASRAVHDEGVKGRAR